MTQVQLYEDTSPADCIPDALNTANLHALQRQYEIDHAPRDAELSPNLYCSILSCYGSFAGEYMPHNLNRHRRRTHLGSGTKTHEGVSSYSNEPNTANLHGLQGQYEIGPARRSAALNPLLCCNSSGRHRSFTGEYRQHILNRHRRQTHQGSGTQTHDHGSCHHGRSRVTELTDHDHEHDGQCSHPGTSCGQPHGTLGEPASAHPARRKH